MTTFIGKTEESTHDKEARGGLPALLHQTKQDILGENQTH